MLKNTDLKKELKGHWNLFMEGNVVMGVSHSMKEFLTLKTRTMEF